MEERRLHGKADFQKLFEELVKPLIPFYAEEKAGLVLGDTASCYGENTVEMEAFLRPLWGLVPFWAGGGLYPELENVYRKGIAAGTDPVGTEYWGGFWDGDQRFVEMAAIAYGMILTPEKIWNPLSSQEKDHLADWLNGINEYELPVCNWIFFAILVNVALKKCGRSYSAEKLEFYLNRVETFYLGGGWYQDGDSGRKDYYVSFAIHFYSLFYSKVMEEEDPERSRLFKVRASEFARDFVYWFDERGAALPYGRSLTYRFSQVSFFSACLMADVLPFSMGQMKGLITRHLRWWLNQKMFDRDGILTIGYAYPNLMMSEIYNAPGSPYWAFKTFAVLMLPDSHPFWSVKEEAMPELEQQKALPYALMLMRRYKGHAAAFIPGKVPVSSDLGHGTEKYGKFVYDTGFGFNVSKSVYTLRDAAPDSMLAFEIDGYVYVRRDCEEFRISDSEVVSVWSPYPGITVETAITPSEDGHVRVHRIESAIECTAYDCGYAVQAGTETSDCGACPDGAWAGNGDTECRVICLEGTGEGVVIGAAPNTNLLHGMTRIPALRHEIKKGTVRLVTKVTAKCEKTVEENYGI